MPYVIADPEMLLTAAADVAGIGSAVNEANAVAAGPTTGVVAAAADEVSTTVANLFGVYGREYQAAVTRVAAFHHEFTQALAAAGAAYAQSEAANLTAVANVINAPIQTLLGRTPIAGIGSGGISPDPVTALIMGGTGDPVADQMYLTAVDESYLQRFGATNLISLFTPEEFWPVTPQLGNLLFGQSVAQGVSLLDAAIKAQLQIANNHVVVFGYSQSSTIATDEIRALMAQPSPPGLGQLSFVLVGDPNNPNGGLLERFSGFYIPFLDTAFNNVTPPNSPYPVTIYTAEYDGIADAPEFPLNALADVNAFMGYFYVHDTYPTLTPTQVANAQLLPTSPGYTGNTQYYMIPTQNLPLLDPIRQIPLVGPPIADWMQPDLRVLVDLGYGNMGYGSDYANIPTPASIFELVNPVSVSVDLARGAVQGPVAALVDVGLLPHYDLPNSYPYLPSTDPGIAFSVGQPTVTGLSELSSDLGSLLDRIFPPPPVPPIVT